MKKEQLLRLNQAICRLPPNFLTKHALPYLQKRSKSLTLTRPASAEKVFIVTIFHECSTLPLPFDRYQAITKTFSTKTSSNWPATCLKHMLKTKSPKNFGLRFTMLQRRCNRQTQAGSSDLQEIPKPSPDMNLLAVMPDDEDLVREKNLYLCPADTFEE
jgi:hypothetical protein